ncbi:MAG: CapA family protein [Myxococcaceae bacterium]|jgi:poly-gamma-glutamate synthesis protein (capsule biosynthesis protein)|nr:CapA family protein [Myxococcaceae bacterium]
MTPFATGLLLVALGASPAERRLTFVFGGDVIPHEPVKKVAKKHARFAADGTPLNDSGWGHVFGPLSPVFRAYDVAVVNLETPVTRLEQREVKEMLFNAPPELLSGLKSAGVDVATFANNHCLDMHPEGITSTRQLLDEVGLATAGAGRTEAEAWTPLVIEKNGVRVALIAVSRWLNKFHNKGGPLDPHVPVVPYLEEPIRGGRTLDEFFAHVRKTAATVDAVIVVIHWGAEYVHEPLSHDRELARGLLEAGALAVIGHHPHVLQPVTTPRLPDGRVGLVAFSLGNLVSNQDYDKADGTKRDGLLLGVELTKPKAGPVVITKVTPVGIGTENRTGTVRRNVQPVVLDEEVLAVQERLAGLAQRAGAVAERRQLEARLSILETRQRRIADMVRSPLPGTRARSLSVAAAPMGATPAR